MTTLAPKLPWQHAFAGGFNRLGGQALPTDPDAIDYLNRVKAADGGVGVEVGVAQAIDAFVRGCKADSAGYAGDPTRTNWDALQACCIMAGARTISGALVPLKGTAPTAQGGWTASEYSRGGSTPGLKGNGSTLYLDTNRANNADPQNDNHNAVYITDPQLGSVITSGVGLTGINFLDTNTSSSTRVINRDGAVTVSGTIASGLYASSRNKSAEYDYRTPQGSGTQSGSSVSPNALNVLLFVRSDGSTLSSYSPARLSFYSIGSALDIAALDFRTTHLMNSIRFTLLTGLSSAGYDPATLAYLLAAYTAGGSLA